MSLKKNFKKTIVGMSVILVSTTIIFQTGLASSGFVNGSSVNLREAATTDSAKVKVLDLNAKVEVIGGSDGWFNINHEGTEGWVHGKFISVGGRTIGTAIVAADNVNVRSGTSTVHKVIDNLTKGETLSLIDTNGNWYKVNTVSGTTGWIWKDLLEVVGIKTSRSGSVERTITQSNPSVNLSLGEKISNYSKKFLGIKYVWGGMSVNGFDCSGLMKYVYSQHGITINRVAADQAKNGTWVSINNLVPGDLVFFDTDGGLNYINHVGIYIGGNKFVHASSGKGHVTTNELTGYYRNNYMTARRIINH